MLIIVASIASLSRGRPTPLFTEVVLHGVCVATAAAAFVAFYVPSAPFGRHFVRNNTLVASMFGVTAAAAAAADDDDDDGSGMPAHVAARAEYDRLVQELLLLWSGLIAAAVLLWLFLRWKYGRAIASWRRKADAAAAEEAADPKSATFARSDPRRPVASTTV